MLIYISHQLLSSLRCHFIIEYVEKAKKEWEHIYIHPSLCENIFQLHTQFFPINFVLGIHIIFFSMLIPSERPYILFLWVSFCSDPSHVIFDLKISRSHLCSSVWCVELYYKWKGGKFSILTRGKHHKSWWLSHLTLHTNHFYLFPSNLWLNHVTIYHSFSSFPIFIWTLCDYGLEIALNFGCENLLRQAPRWQ